MVCQSEAIHLQLSAIHQWYSSSSTAGSCHSFSNRTLSGSKIHWMRVGIKHFDCRLHSNLQAEYPATKLWLLKNSTQRDDSSPLLVTYTLTVWCRPSSRNLRARVNGGNELHALEYPDNTAIHTSQRPARRTWRNSRYVGSTCT